MKQLDLIEYIESLAVIKAMPPAQATQQRAFVIEQLAPIMREFEALDVSPTALAEAMAFYLNKYREQAQQDLLKK